MDDEFDLIMMRERERGSAARSGSNRLGAKAFQAWRPNDFTCDPGVGYLFRNIELSFRPQFNFAASGLNVYHYNFRLGYAIRKKKGNYATVDSTLPKINLTS